MRLLGPTLDLSYPLPQARIFNAGERTGDNFSSVAGEGGRCLMGPT